jgi:hypothetical protein
MLIPNNMQSIKDHVHHLDSTTLKPFVESKGAVLLSVVLLPMSRLCLRFVPEYEKVSSPIRRAVFLFFLLFSSKLSGPDCRKYATFRYHIRTNRFSGQWRYLGPVQHIYISTFHPLSGVR